MGHSLRFENAQDLLDEMLKRRSGFGKMSWKTMKSTLNVEDIVVAQSTIVQFALVS